MGQGRAQERFPAEHLLIVEGQKIPQHKQTPGLVEVLLTVNHFAVSHVISLINCSTTLLNLNSATRKSNKAAKNSAFGMNETQCCAHLASRFLHKRWKINI